MLPETDYEMVGGRVGGSPPVREAANRQPLWNALMDGTIDMIATDHAPHAPDEQTRNDIWIVDCGFPGAETQMPLMLTKINRRRPTIQDSVRWSGERPDQHWSLHPCN